MITCFKNPQTMFGINFKNGGYIGNHTKASNQHIHHKMQHLFLHFQKILVQMQELRMDMCNMRSVTGFMNVSVGYIMIHLVLQALSLAQILMTHLHCAVISASI